MKTIISALILMAGLLVITSCNTQVLASALTDQTSITVNNQKVEPAGSVSQEEGDYQVEIKQTNVEKTTTGSFLARNWGALTLGLLGFFDLVARLTPSEKDNSILNFLNSVLNAIIPNLKKGGGRL